MITFTIRGRITSANRVTRHVGGLALKSASARADHERIKQLAWVATKEAIIDPAAVTITAHNSRLDAGNIEKVINDAMRGVCIFDDNPRHLRRLLVEHVRDRGGERYVVRVEAA